MKKPMTPRVRIMRSFLTSPRGLHQFECQIVCYAIDNAPHTSSFSLETVINKLGKNTNHLTVRKVPNTISQLPVTVIKHKHEELKAVSEKFLGIKIETKVLLKIIFPNLPKQQPKKYTSQDNKLHGLKKHGPDECFYNISF